LEKQKDFSLKRRLYNTWNKKKQKTFLPDFIPTLQTAIMHTRGTRAGCQLDPTPERAWLILS
jgi:hypothetical protein